MTESLKHTLDIINDELRSVRYTTHHLDAIESNVYSCKICKNNIRCFRCEILRFEINDTQRSKVRDLLDIYDKYTLLLINISQIIRNQQEKKINQTVDGLFNNINSTMDDVLDDDDSYKCDYMD